MLRWILVLLHLAGTLGCGDGASGNGEPPVCRDEAVPEGPSLRFQLDDDGHPPAWLDVPFPSDLYRDAAGAVWLPELPYAGQIPPQLREALTGLDGFGVTTGAFLAVDGDLSASRGELQERVDGGAARLVGPGGEEVALEVGYDASAHLLALAPARGQVLLQRSRHLLVVTEELGVAAAPGLRGLLSGACAGTAADAVAPVREALAAAGVAPDGVAAAVTFTTRDLTGDLEAMRDRVEAADPPPLTVTHVFPGELGTLDDLLGPAGGAGPGLDGGAAHSHLSHVLHGTVDVPLYLSEAPAKQGVFARGADGRPEPRTTETLAFTLALPVGAKADLPLVLFQHGVSADRSNVFGVADAVAAAGAAVLAVDLPLHGARSPQAADRRTNVTDADGPDGMADSSGPLTGSYMFGLLLVDDSNPPYHPHLPRDAFRQGAADHMAVLRALTRGDLAPLRAADPALAELSLSGDVAVIGESLGAIVGGLTVAVDPLVEAASLVVGGGGLVTHLAFNSPQYNKTIVAIIAVPLGFDFEAIEYDVFPPWLYPTVNLYQWALEPADPLAYAPYLFRAPTDARPPPDLLMVEAFADESMPNQATEALASAYGVHQVALATGTAPLRYADVPAAQAPAGANLATPAGPATGAIVQFAPATHGTLLYPTGKQVHEPVFPPFDRRPVAARETIDNPIGRVQALVTGFLLGERGAEGRALTTDPAP